MRFPVNIMVFKSPLLLQSGILPDKQAFLEVRIPPKAKIGSVLRLARYLQQFTQEEVAEALFENQKTISRVELGDLDDFLLIGKLARFYRLSIDQYLQEAYPDS